MYDAGQSVFGSGISSTLVAFVLSIWVSLCAEQANAERRHLVKPGQSLARIARRYRVSVAELTAANTLPRDTTLRPGQVLIVPSAGEVFVRKGQTLSSIARKYKVSVDGLAKQNGLRSNATLQPGQRLLLPGFEAAEEKERAEKRWGRPKHPGVATFYRASTSEKARIRLIDRHGRVRKTAFRRLRHLLRPRHSRKRKSPHPRLVRLLARISDHFGGRTISIISGYRLPGGLTKRESRHVFGKAVDFRVRGVPTETLAAYCRKFDHVGVGYYPTSRFVHLDVRDSSAFWTDWSGPGEPPKRKAPDGRSDEKRTAPTAKGFNALVDGDETESPASDVRRETGARKKRNSELPRPASRR